MTDPASGQPGFTLIELLVVVVVVGVLASLGVVSFRAAMEEARLATLQADMRAVAIQQELYYQQTHSYGAMSDLPDVVLSEGVSITVNHADNVGVAMVATHAGVAGAECGYFRGTVPGGAAGPAVNEDEITCTP